MLGGNNLSAEMKRVCLALFPFVFVCCGQVPDRNKSNDCAKYNNRAVEALQKFMSNGDSSSLITSMGFYNEAIKCDSTNVINYQGKLTVLNLLGRLGESLIVIDKIYSLSGKTEIQMIVTKGVIYERMHKFDSCKIFYDLAFQQYDDLLREKPKDSIKIICERLYLVAIVDGKTAAIRKLEEYLAKVPSDPTLLAYQEVLMVFDRKAIVPDE